MLSRLLEWLVALLILSSWTVAMSDSTGSAPRTSWGDPDLQGTWDYRTATPFERPEVLGNRSEFQETEAATFERTNDERAERRVRARGPFVGDEPWADRGRELTEGSRASLIVDPPDGHLPARTALGETLIAHWKQTQSDPPAGPEQRNLLERCVANIAAVPLRSINFNNNLQIVQTRDHLMIHYGMVHDTRIIPLIRKDGDQPSVSTVRQYHGQSTARWTGDTLVVRTTHFRDQLNQLGLSAKRILVERFTRKSPETLTYEYTMEDGMSYTGPWTARQTLKRLDGLIYEYACHEGNSSMTFMLESARAEESFATKNATTAEED